MAEKKVVAAAGAIKEVIQTGLFQSSLVQLVSLFTENEPAIAEFPMHHPLEDIGLEDFLMPVDEDYETDCTALKEAFASGLVENIDPEIAKRMFYRNLPFLQAVQAGKLFSIRHKEFHSDIEKPRCMAYAPGSIILGDFNLGIFMQLMGKVLATSNDDRRDKIPYFMLVLIPELITKILMGVYNISKQEAVKKKRVIGIWVTKNTEGLFD